MAKTTEAIPLVVKKAIFTFLKSFGYWYWIGVAFFTGLLIYQHTLVKPTDLRNVNMAFFTTNGIASVVFAIFVILDLFLS